MRQQPALQRVARHNQLERILEITARLRFSPGAVRTERFQMERCFVAFERMAVIATTAAGALFDENRLDTRGEELEIGTLCSKDCQQKEGPQKKFPETHRLYYGSASVL